MLEILLLAVTLSSMLLVVYHHAIYPLILRAVQRSRKIPTVDVSPRQYDRTQEDDALPHISILIPAYNEAAWIQAKIYNLVVLDYPSDKLKVVLACDGCTDDTAAIARHCMAQPECADLNLQIREFRTNRGKVAVINEVMREMDTELVAMSDVSALISVDALLIAAAQFNDPRLGVLNSHYRLLSPGSEGEANYWRYQSNIKSCEAALGATLGAHGAFYLFRRQLFRELAPDTINDDFVLPMQIVAQGYRAGHDTRIMALELEQADLNMDRTRRQRISAGNLQQLIRLKQLLRPRYRGVAFAFASGKGLRVAMPLLMLVALCGSWLLRDQSWFFLFAAWSQVALYTVAGLELMLKPSYFPKLFKTLGYIVGGHVAGLMGSLDYMLRSERKAWKRVTPVNATHRK